MLKKRSSNYELMRIISMFLIVLYHTIYHGFAIDLAVNHYTKIILELLRLVTIVHVNSFILMTGFFQSQSKFRLSKVLDLVLLSTFYKLVIIIIFDYCDLVDFSVLQLIKELFPLELVHNWYFRYYIVLYFLSPFINTGLNLLNKKSFKNLILVLVFFFSVIPMLTNGVGFPNDGYTLYQFIFMYLIGAYFRKFPLEIKCNKFIYRILLIIIFCLCVFLNYLLFRYSLLHLGESTLIGELSSYYQLYYLYYSNIIIVVQSLSYFLFFGTFNFNNNLINHVSKMMFGIYLLHDNNYIRANIYTWMNINNDLIYSFRYFMYVIWIALIIFVISYIIESVRYYVCYVLKKVFKFNKLERKLDNFQLVDK